MRILHLINEAESYTARSAEIRRKLKAQGYKLIGSGSDATVWAKAASPDVLKVIMPDGGGGSKSAQTFFKFYEFCKEHQDIPNLPRFRELETFEVDGVEYTSVAMERLQPLQEGTFEEIMIYIFSYLVPRTRTWGQALAALKDPHTYRYVDGPDPAEIVRHVRSLDRTELAQYRVVFSLLMLLYRTGRINRFGWDVHGGNVMQRRDGTLVVIDPWFGTNIN